MASAPLITWEPRVDIALLLVRIFIGVIFIAHGYQKVFEAGYAGVYDAFVHMGVFLPAITSFLNMWVELLAGVALVIGLLTRLAAIGLIIDMVGAIVIVHHGSLIGRGGMELELALIAGCAALALVGAGRYSLDYLIAARRVQPAAA